MVSHMTTSMPAAGGSMDIDDPTDLTRADYFQAFKNTLKEVKDDDVPGLAGGVAFKMFLSLFPSLLAAVAIFSIVVTPAELADWVSEARGILPKSALDFLTTQLEDLTAGEGSAGLAAVLGVAAGIFAATSAAVSLMKALSRAYDVPETRKFVRQRLVGLALTVALVLTLTAIVLLLVIGRQVQEALLGSLASPFDMMIAGARFLLALVVLVLLFAFVYWAGPNRDHPSWVWMSPGAVLGVVGWLAISGLFTVYAQNFGKYNETYGTIGGVIVLLLWLQLSMLAMLLGAEFNAEVERMKSVHKRVGEGAGFAAPAASAMAHADPEGGTATLMEAQTSSHAVHPVSGDVEPTLEMPAPSLLPPVTETSPTVELQASELTPPVSEASPTVELAAPTFTQPAVDDNPGGPSSAMSTRNAGALTAGFMALAVFLGFARRRSRR